MRDGLEVTIVGAYIVPLAAGSLRGPLRLGTLFDTVARRRMIGGTYMRPRRPDDVIPIRIDVDSSKKTRG